MLPKLLTEFVGTFFLVLTIGLTVLGRSPFASLAIGFVLAAMVFMGGHVSGGHYNPAVSLAVWLRGRMPAAEVGPYMGVQVLGGFLAALTAGLVYGQPLVVAPAATAPLAAFILLELLFAMILALVVLNVATARGTDGNSFYGLAIGLTVMAGAYAAGPVSGGAFNPAVALGPFLASAVQGGPTSGAHLLVYVLATLAGGALAAGVFRLQNPSDRGPVSAGR
ncbi:MAG: MIP/aquaporin family protein [Rubricoccaceae bacterium]